MTRDFDRAWWVRCFGVTERQTSVHVVGIMTFLCGSSSPLNVGATKQDQNGLASAVVEPECEVVCCCGRTRSAFLFCISPQPGEQQQEEREEQEQQERP